MNVAIFKTGDKVAIMPSENAMPNDVLEIGAVAFAGGVYVQLLDGRMYATLGCHSLGTNKQSYIVPATPEHFAALQAKQIQQTVSVPV